MLNLKESVGDNNFASALYLESPALRLWGTYKINNDKAGLWIKNEECDRPEDKVWLFSLVLKRRQKGVEACLN